MRVANTRNMNEQKKLPGSFLFPPDIYRMDVKPFRGDFIANKYILCHLGAASLDYFMHNEEPRFILKFGA